MDPKLRLKRDAGSPTGYYIPRDLDEALRELANALSPEWKRRFIGHSRGDETAPSIETGFGLTDEVERAWAFIPECGTVTSSLREYFNAHGLCRADQMSRFLFAILIDYLNRRPLTDDVVRSVLYEEFGIIGTNDGGAKCAY